MTNNKQQTPVEWYISKIKEARNFCDDPTMEMDIRHTLEVLIKKGEQAKEMEKEQRSIELPSDEEIDEKAFKVPYDNTKDFYDLQFIKGAKWMRDKIQGGNK